MKTVGDRFRFFNIILLAQKLELILYKISIVSEGNRNRRIRRKKMSKRGTDRQTESITECTLKDLSNDV